VNVSIPALSDKDVADPEFAVPPRWSRIANSCPRFPRPSRIVLIKDFLVADKALVCWRISA